MLERLTAGPSSSDVLRADADRIAELLLSGRATGLADGRIART